MSEAHSIGELIDGVKNSRYFLGVLGNGVTERPAFYMSLGVAVCEDKPIILICLKGCPLSETLAHLATHILWAEALDETTVRRLAREAAEIIKR